MHRLTGLVLMLVLMPLLLVAEDIRAEPASAPQIPKEIAFVRVNVVPMDEERILRDQTILIRDGKIAAMGRSLRLPAGIQVIDGGGTAYVSPGLVDMHVHSDTAQDLIVYLANGVTRIANMGDARPGFVARTRAKANRGEIPGPQVHAAFIVDGTPLYAHFFVETPEQARAVVGLAKTNGYDFLKVYNTLPADAFAALAEEARAQHVPVTGHGVTAVGLQRQIDSGQQLVAHAEEFLYTVFLPPGTPADALPTSTQMEETVAWLKQRGTFVTADLNTYATIAGQWGRPEVLASHLRNPHARYLPPEWRNAWRGSGYAKRDGPGIEPTRDFLARFINAMSDAGVPLVMGTDAPSIPGLVPGYAVHDNLRALHEAGLSNYQALATATRQPGTFFQRFVPGAESFGTVRTGQRADLVMSAGNPLDDLSVLRDPHGVMVGGRWYASGELHTLLETVARDYEAMPPPAAASERTR